MVLARTLGVALTGVSGQVVEIECDISAGLPGLSFTGLADTSVVESRDRIRAAVLNSGVSWPNRKITVALFPADVRKVGSGFDLAVALAVLASAEAIPLEAIADAVWIAELGLDGRLRPVRGVLPAVVTARRAGVHRVVVAQANAAEAALVQGMDVRAAGDLREVVGWLRGDGAAPPVAALDDDPDTPGGGPDLADVAGQGPAKRALEVAAAGGHHLYLIGAPGAGKTMLAERLPGLLPALDDAAALEVTAVHSVAGQLGERARLVRRPPLQAPHHTASVASLVGGGSHLARPGAISLAHHGRLVPRRGARVLAPCARRIAPAAGERVGRAAPPRRSGELPGPVPARPRGQSVPVRQPGPRLRLPAAGAPPLPAAAVRAAARPDRRAGAGRPGAACRPVRAGGRARDQRHRGRPRRGGPSAPRPSAGGAHRGGSTRACPAPRFGRAPWALAHPVLQPAEAYLQRGEISARGFDRVLRLAWTIADLAGRNCPETGDVAEALYFRTGSSGAWAA